MAVGKGLGKAKHDGKVAEGGPVGGMELAVPEDKAGKLMVAMDVEEIRAKEGAG